MSTRRTESHAGQPAKPSTARTWSSPPVPSRSSSVSPARPSTPSPSTRSSTPSGCGCTFSTCFKTPPSRTRAHCTSWSSVAVRPGSKHPGQSPSSWWPWAVAPRAPVPGRVTLVDRGARCSAPSPRSRRNTRPNGSATRGSRSCLGSGVASVHADHLVLDDGSTIDTRTVVWGGGESAATIVAGHGTADRPRRTA